MKLFLRIIAIAFFILLSTQEVDAQKAYRKTFYGDFFGGMTLSTMDMEGNNAYKNLKLGFQIGANFKYRFAYNIELQSGLYLIKKGLEQKEAPEKTIEGLPGVIIFQDIKNTVDANYIQVPLNIGFEIPLSKAKNIYFSAHAGLFGAYGFKGDTKIKGYEAKRNKNEDGTLGNMYDRLNYDSAVKTFSDSNLKRWDYGLNFNAALIYDMFVFQFQYDHGRANVATSTKSAGEWKTRNYSLSLGFRF